MKKVLIKRLSETENQTLGKLTTEKLTLATLELGNKGNQRNISRIPAGEYICTKRWTIKRGWHIKVNNVNGRDNILIHTGNYNTDIKGCILVGLYHRDINGDGVVDISHSKQALDILTKELTETFILKIQD